MNTIKTIPSEVVNCEFLTKTKTGITFAHQVTLTVNPVEIEFTKAPFALKDEIKSMEGSRWHGFDEENPRKVWTVNNSQRNWFQIKWLMGINVYEAFERDIIQHEYRELTNAELYAHQKHLADIGLTYHYQIWAADMGCIDGDAIVNLNRRKRGFKITLKELYTKFHSAKNWGTKKNQHVWNSNFPTYIRSLCNGIFRLNKIKNVLYNGKKPVLKMTLKSGKILRCTADHEIAINNTTFKRIDELKPKDIVLTNGHFVDKDGYIRISNLKNKHPRWTTGGVYEHILVAEKKYGRPIKTHEIIHHINGIRSDNRANNLMLLSSSNEHAFLHGRKNLYINLDGGRGRVFFVPKEDEILSIKSDGMADVYDIICEDPYRNFVANGIVVHNCGKSLAAQMVIEKSGVCPWWWIGPLKSLDNIKMEFDRFQFPKNIDLTFTTYERFEKLMQGEYFTVPQGVIFDESSRLKTPSANRSVAAQKLADMIRTKYGDDGYVLLLTGTPSPKSPLDWWKQAEIVSPGFIKEGSIKALKERLAFLEEREHADGIYKHLSSWRDDENKCKICGEFKDVNVHQPTSLGYHPWQKSSNEVELLHERLKGIVTVIRKEDVLDLPDKIYEIDACDIDESTKRAAKVLVQSATNAMIGMTWLRELSDGFLYKNEPNGTTTCITCASMEKTGYVLEWYDPENENFRFLDTTIDFNNERHKNLKTRFVICPVCNGTTQVPRFTRTAKEITCPKIEKLEARLEECEETGRIVIFAAFQASIDRIEQTCLGNHWNVLRCDGRGWQITTSNNEILDIDPPLKYWNDLDNEQVAFVSHPKSGGLSLNLMQSRMAVFYSNDFNPESRFQAEDRIHRIGTDKNRGCKIVDIYHLPSDEKAHKILKENRKLELMTLGEFKDMFKD